MALSLNSWLPLIRTQVEKPSGFRGNAKKVIDALRVRKMTTEQLQDATGLTAEQVREVFRRHRGRAIISEPVRYSLAPLNGDIDSFVKML